MAVEKQQVALEPWLRATANVDVVEEVEGARDEWRYLIRVSNGEEGESFVGTTIARCKNSEEAVLVAEALRRMGNEEDS